MHVSSSVILSTKLDICNTEKLKIKTFEACRRLTNIIASMYAVSVGGYLALSVFLPHESR